MKVKICGITNKDDAVWAVNYGADLIGLNFYRESPRHITLSAAKKWVPELPPFAALVGVFVNAPMEDVARAAAELKLKGVQLHGDETPSDLASLRVLLQGQGLSPFIVKAVRVADETSLSVLDAYRDVVDYFLLDAYKAGQEGGTGETFNWDLAIRAKEAGKPVILAGGLTPVNVREAVKKTSPWGVDVASGVEKSPKRKDLDKMRDFITLAKKG